MIYVHVCSVTLQHCGLVNPIHAGHSIFVNIHIHVSGNPLHSEFPGYRH